MFERAHKRNDKPTRKITFRGKVLNMDDPDPVSIARAIKKSKPGKTLKERKAAMEAKFAGR